MRGPPLPLLGLLLLGACDASGEGVVAFTRRVLDERFLAEGVTAFDVDGDGRLDIVSGDQWFAAPAFDARPLGAVTPLDPATQYSPAFGHAPMDVDGDGWIDLVTFGFPLTSAVWRRNPGDGTAWPTYPLWAGSAQESPRIEALELPGRPEGRVAIFQPDPTHLGLFAPGADLAAPWEPRLLALPAGVEPLGGHGLGAGDLDGDGRRDLVTPRGFWSMPAAAADEWRFTAADLGPDCAQMQVADVSGDGLADVITSSAHGVGVFWHEQRRDGGAISFVRHAIFDGFSQSHALEVADMNGDGLLDIVTGKRMWAHGPDGDVDPAGPRVLYWFEQVRGAGAAEPRFEPHLIDADSGVGTQLFVGDIDGDGRPDIAVANKRGTFYFEQR